MANHVVEYVSGYYWRMFLNRGVANHVVEYVSDYYWRRFNWRLVHLVLSYILLTITRSGSSCSWLYIVDDYEEWFFLFLDIYCWRLRGVVHLVLGYILLTITRCGSSCSWLYIVDHYEEWIFLFLVIYCWSLRGVILLVLGYILLTITRSGSSCSWLYDVDDYEEWLFLFLDTLSCITVGGLPENWFFSCWWLYMGVYYRKRLRPVVHLVVGYILIVDHYEERSSCSWMYCFTLLVEVCQRSRLFCWRLYFMDVYYRKRLKPGVAHLVVGYIIDHYIQR